MRLHEINNTKSTYENIAINIMSTCKPYLTEIGYDMETYALYRGAGKAPNPVVMVPGYRNNRKPKDTPIHLHAAINRVFKAKFGVPFRNGTFATSNAADADAYGSVVYVIIPLGDFKFLWSRGIIDLYDYFRRKVQDDFGKYEDINGDNPAVIGSLLKYVNTPVFAELYQNTDLKAGIASEHEVMLYCEQCYYIDCNIYSKIAQIIMTKHDVPNFGL